jgi:hypothetical protein
MATRCLFLLASLLVATVSDPASSQNSAQARWISSTTTWVKPDKRQEFEGYVKQLMTAHKKAGTPSFLTLETFAGDTTEYVSIVPVVRFGDLEGPSAVIGALGEANWRRLSRNMARCYTAQTVQYATPQSELEIRRTDVPMGIYWVETTSLIVPGKLGDYLNWLRNDYLPVLAKADVGGVRVSRPIFGASAGEVVTARMLRSLAEIDDGAVLSRAVTEEEARAITAKAVPLVISSRTRIVRVRADLSYSSDRQ